MNISRDFFWFEFYDPISAKLHFRQCRLRDALQVCRQHRLCASLFNAEGKRIAWINQSGWWDYALEQGGDRSD